MSGFEARLATRIAAIVSTIETVAGKIVPSEANLARVASLVAEMKASFVDDQLLEDIADYLESFDTVGADVFKAMKPFGTLDDGMMSAVTRQFKSNTAAYLLNPESYAATLWQPIANNLVFGVATNSLLSGTIGAATSVVTGSLEADTQGAVSMEIAGTVQSAPTMLQRTSTAVAADQLDVQFFLYQGRSIDTTRPFCKARAGIVWHKKEIEEWGRLAANGTGWDGMVEGTNPQTIFIYLGGWYGKTNNCRHVLVPVAKRDVPSEDYNRMRDKGLVV